MIMKAAKRIFNSDKICRSYCDLYFGVTFLEHSVEWFCYLKLKTAPLDKTPECDGKTDRQTDGRTDSQTSSGYYSGLHCEQCGHDVKIPHGWSGSDQVPWHYDTGSCTANARAHEYSCNHCNVLRTAKSSRSRNFSYFSFLIRFHHIVSQRATLINHYNHDYTCH